MTEPESTASGDGDAQAALRSSRLFADLPAGVLLDLSGRLQRRSFKAGERLMQQGERGDCMMLLQSGRASAHLRNAAGGTERIGTFEAGDIVGEMALLTSEPRSADVIADVDTDVLVIAEQEYDALAHRHPQLCSVLTEIVADRLGCGGRDGLGDKVLGGCRIERCVGRGGMGVVYRAFDEVSQHTVALKMMSHRLLYAPGAIRRFQIEAEMLERLDHHNIASIYRTFSAFHTRFIVLEYCDGPSLHAWLARTGPVAESIARPILGQLARAVTYLHSKHVLHRDLKPGNVMLNRDGSVKLTDFGLAQPSQPIGGDLESGTEVRVVGTPWYMAPEQLDGEQASIATDVYSFGCVAFEVLSGQRLFGATTMPQLMREKQVAELPSRRRIGLGLSWRLARYLRACLSCDPRKRLHVLPKIARWAAPVSVPID